MSSTTKTQIQDFSCVSAKREREKRGLLTDHDGPGDDGLVLGVGLDPVVESDGVKDEEELALVLVDPLGLDVKYGGGIQPEASLLLPVVGELDLVLNLDLKGRENFAASHPHKGS